MGVIIAVVAVFEMNIDRTAVTNMNPNMIHLGVEMVTTRCVRNMEFRGVALD